MIAEGEEINIRCYDSHLKKFLYYSKNIYDAVKNTDSIVLVTNHNLFKNINNNSLKVRNKNLIDKRNILNHYLCKDASYRVRILEIGNSKRGFYEI